MTLICVYCFHEAELTRISRKFTYLHRSGLRMDTFLPSKTDPLATHRVASSAILTTFIFGQFFPSFLVFRDNSFSFLGLRKFKNAEKLSKFLKHSLTAEK